AHAEVKRPDIGESVVKQVADQVAVLRHDEQVAGRCQTVDDQDDIITFGAAEPRQVKAQAILGRERMHGHVGACYPVKGVPGDTARHLSSSSSAGATVYGAGSGEPGASW